MSFYQSKGCCEEMALIEIVILILFVVFVFSLFSEEGGTAGVCLAALIFLLFIGFAESKSSLTKKGFDSVQSALPSKVLSPISTLWAHAPNTPVGCRVKLDWDGDAWHVVQPAVEGPVTNASQLAKERPIKEWCAKAK